MCSAGVCKQLHLRKVCLYNKKCILRILWRLLRCKVAAMNRSRTLPSDPEFLLQYMEDIDSDCSDDEFDGYIDNEVIQALPGEMNNSGTAMEMMDMIMNGCNIDSCCRGCSNGK